MYKNILKDIIKFIKYNNGIINNSCKNLGVIL